MGRVGTGFFTSLDGLIAGPNDEVAEVLRWYARGDTEFLSGWARGRPCV